MALAIDPSRLTAAGKKRRSVNAQTIEIANADGTNRRALTIPDGQNINLLDCS